MGHKKYLGYHSFYWNSYVVFIGGFTYDGFFLCLWMIRILKLLIIRLKKYSF